MPSLTPHTAALGPRLAAHLLRRATFCVDKAAIVDYALKTPQDALDDLLDTQALWQVEPLDHQTSQPFVNSGTPPQSQGYELKRNIRSWWIEEALRDRSAGHRIEFFLHTMLVAQINVGNQAGTAFDHLALLRQCATRYTNGGVNMDSYKELAYRMVTDQVMLVFLDGSSNNKWAPNENCAREFFELFTIGAGPQIAPDDYTTYTETDITEAARLLTGWQVRERPYNGPTSDPDLLDPVTGLQRGDANYNRHDTDPKQFSAAFQSTLITGATDEAGMWVELRAFVEMVFAQDATAQNICRKLYRFFVSDVISAEVEADIIVPLAVELKANDYRLSVAIRRLLESQHFYDLDDADATDNIIGGLVRSPLDLLLSTMSFFGIERPDIVTDPVAHYETFYANFVHWGILFPAGLDLFTPPTVAGYPAYHQAPTYSKNWFNSATLIARYKQPEYLIWSADYNGGVALDLVGFVANSGIVTTPADGESLVDELLACLFSEAPAQERRDYFLNDVFLDGLSLINWQFEWQNFENTGDESAVCIPIKALLIAILSSQEYGCM